MARMNWDRARSNPRGYEAYSPGYGAGYRPRKKKRTKPAKAKAPPAEVPPRLKVFAENLKRGVVTWNPMAPVAMSITRVRTEPTHFPVTTSQWRGVRHWPSVAGTKRTIRRACDWRRAATPVDTGRFSLLPSCPDCDAYRSALLRMSRSARAT